jgi:hypothetical protein
MASMPWIKLHTDFLDDPKLARASDINKLRFVQLCILAGICDNDGALVDGETILDDEYIASRLQVRPTLMSSSLQVLNELRLIDRIDGVWFVTNFAKRQGRPQSEKRAKWREWQNKRRERKASVMHDSGMSHAGVIGIEGEKEKEGEREGEKSAPDKTLPGVTPQTTPAPAYVPTVSAPEGLKTQPKPKSLRRAERSEDEQKREPAILAYAQVFRVQPNPAQRAAILREVTDPVKWGGVCQQWALKGFKAGNIQGMLEVYAQGWRIAAPGWPTPGAGRPPNRSGKFTRPQVGQSTPEQVAEAREVASARVATRNAGTDRKAARIAEAQAQLAKPSLTAEQRNYWQQYLASAEGRA